MPSKVRTDSFSIDDELNIRYFTELIKKYDVSVRSVDWGSRASQELRFRILAEIGELHGAKILDIGCGLGDFYNWLCNHGISVEYYGIDITSEIIKKAVLRFPGLSLKISNLLKDYKNIENEYDYLFASGIFYRRAEAPYKFFENMIFQMYRLCTKGVAFNSLSTWSNKKNLKEFNADPLKILAICKEITPKIVFKHNYLPNDFTIYLYKS